MNHAFICVVSVLPTSCEFYGKPQVSNKHVNVFNMFIESLENVLTPFEEKMSKKKRTQLKMLFVFTLRILDEN